MELYLVKLMVNKVAVKDYELVNEIEQQKLEKENKENEQQTEE